MAATLLQGQGIVIATTQMAAKIKALKFMFDQVLANNSAQSINWGTVSNAAIPGFLDSNGLIILPGSAVGVITPAQVSNVIGSMAALTGAYWTTNGGNYELVTTPIV